MVCTIIGSVSDIIGKKKVLVANKLGNFVSIVVSTFITYYHLYPYYFLIPSKIWNLVGGYSVMLGVTFATVTSYSPYEKRFSYIGKFIEIFYFCRFFSQLKMQDLIGTSVTPISISTFLVRLTYFAKSLNRVDINFLTI